MRSLFNTLGKNRTPFLFIIDFDNKNSYISPLNQLDKDIFFSMPDFTHHTYVSKPMIPIALHIQQAISMENYARAFQQVIAEMVAGNTYLLNLTFPTKIKLNVDLLDVFHASDAPFKLYFKDQFITFSPERFIKIENNIIKTFPMKGTIDATIPDAKTKILTNLKEKAEHTMVVDLLRNDLSIVAKQVRLKKFRYIDKIKAGQKELLQVSSEISGVLPHHWHENIGDILCALLPAGSITGTPKKKTVEIIKHIENYDRGFFTGIFGYFDGYNLDSAVMIRFIEKQNEMFIYKSGGGITIDSNVEQEYQELLNKVYLPI